MKNINYQIEKVEKKWLSQLYKNCELLFTKTKIPSHDHTHHFRVWNYCKEIILALHQDIAINYDLIEGCLIASFFHDTGLTQTLDENHGTESKEICKNYFNSNKLNYPVNFDEILLAIEKHDDKNYQQEKQEPDSLLTILCNADDLDAFGNIGVIRYTEIYLLRGIKMNHLPELIIKNIDNRFRHFKQTYKDYSILYKKHETRYLITLNFFKKLKQEL